MSTPLLAALILLQSPAPQEAEHAPRNESELARLAFDAEANLILVEARIGASEPLTFVLDTGAPGVVLDTGVAERLELSMGGTQKRPASNRKELTYRYATSVPIRIADQEMIFPRVFVAPFVGSASFMIGKTIHGILGHALFSRYVVEVDYEHRQLVLHDPATYRYEGDGTVLPLDFTHSSGLPYTALTIEPRPGEAQQLNMLVDTGGSLMGTLGFGLRSTIDALVPDDAPRVPMLGATGLADTAEGTTHAVFATRLHRVQIGPYAIDRPSVGCDSTSHTGHDLFGAELLHRFHVVFDYGRLRMILEPNAAYSEPSFTEMSGMMLVAAEDDLSVRRILFVSPNSPAAEAGIEEGDELIEIDGLPADAQSLHATRLFFCKPGEFRLKVRRGEKTWTTTLRARELL